MEGDTVLNDEQLARLKRLWLSGLDGCPRSTYHRVMDTPKAHKHYYSQRGSLGHQIAEAMLMGEQIRRSDADFGDFEDEEDQEKMLHDLGLPMDNMRDWMEDGEMDLAGLECEVHVEKELDLGYTLSGRIDVLTPTHILDFKTGKKKVQKSHRLQLMGSLDITRGLDGIDRECRIVFLGNPKAPATVDPFKKTKKMDWDDYVQEYEDAIASQIAYREMIRVGKQVPVKFGFLCAMCDYRHICNGV